MRTKFIKLAAIAFICTTTARVSQAYNLSPISFENFYRISAGIVALAGSGGGGGSSNSDDAEITSGEFDKTYANNDALQIKGTNNLSLESDEVYTLAKKQFTVKTDTSKDAWAAAITANCRSHITPCAPALVTPKATI